MSERRSLSPSPSPAGRRTRREAGSAYLIVLLVLVVLSLLGLSLALLTQTEMQIGANERVIQRVFYSADTGASDAVMRAQVTGDYAPREFTLRDAGGGFLVPDLGNNVQVSRFLPIQDSPCNLCQINQGSDFYKVNHIVAAVATRTGTLGGTEVPLAEKTLSVMIEFQPWPLSTQALNATAEELQLLEAKL